MSIATRIESIEEHIGNAYDELQGLGADLTNVNKNIENISMVLDDIYDSMPQVSGEGTSLTLDDTRVGKIKSTLKGNTSQTGTPTPTSPIPVNVVSGDNEINVVGKNLFDINNAYHGTINASGVLGPNESFRTSDYITTVPNTQYYFSTTQIVGQTNKQIYIAYYDSSKTFISRDSYNELEHLFTTPTNCYFMRAGVFTANQENVMLEKGSSATTYEPYSGNLYEIDLRIGKNLFNINTIVKGYELNSNTGKTQENANWWLSDYIAIKPNTNYISSNISSDTKCWYDKYKNFISKVQSVTGTSPANAKYLRVNGTISSIESEPNAMIEEGNNATTFEAYNSIELCKIGNYQDYFGKSDGRNLFDKSTITTSAYLKEDGTLQTGTGAEYITSDFIPVKPNTTYYKTQTLSPRTKFYDKNKQVLDSSTYQDISIGGNAGSFTTPNNAYYFRFTGNVNTSTGININTTMVNEGSSALPYEPYGVGKWYLHKEIGKVVLDGSESSLSRGGTGTTGYYRWRVVLDNPLLATSTTTIVPLLCNRLANVTVANTYGGREGFAIDVAGNYAFFYIDETKTYSLDDTKVWLASNNLVVYYILATPVNTALEDM